MREWRSRGKRLSVVYGERGLAREGVEVGRRKGGGRGRRVRREFDVIDCEQCSRNPKEHGQSECVSTR